VTVYNRGQVRGQEQIIEEQKTVNDSPYAYWDKHQLYKMSVKEFIFEFCGWTAIQELINHPFNYLQRNKAFLSALFLTGGRVTEVLSLKKEYFKAGVDSQGRPTIIVTGMMLEKHYRKISDRYKGEDGKWHYETQKVLATRKPFVIKLAEPLAEILWNWIKDCQDEYLFKSPHRHSKVGHLTRKWAYKYIIALDKAIPKQLKELLGLMKPFVIEGEKIADSLHLWCHWFRSQRASQLVENYDFKIEDLMSYFSWRDIKIALRYLHIGVHVMSDRMNTDLLKGAR